MNPNQRQGPPTNGVEHALMEALWASYPDNPDGFVYTPESPENFPNIAALEEMPGQLFAGFSGANFSQVMGYDPQSTLFQGTVSEVINLGSGLLIRFSSLEQAMYGVKDLVKCESPEPMFFAGMPELRENGKVIRLGMDAHLGANQLAVTAEIRRG